MPERLRFSDEPRTLQILREFALRQLPTDASIKDVVLADVRLPLTYATGETFWYTLEPRNFSVRECDPLERLPSPINGLTRTRRVVFAICDEAATWHEPIGTTCILKDIFGITDEEVNATETLLLDASHHAQQQRFYDQAGSLDDYARLNDLDPGWFSEGYLRDLEHRDPIRAALERLLKGKVLDRATLKHLRKAQRVGKTPREQAQTHFVAQHPPKLQPALPRPVAASRGTVTVSGMLLNWLRPNYAELAAELSGEHAEEARRLLGRSDEYLRTQFFPCKLEFLTELRSLTGSALTDEELRTRQRSQTVLTPEQREAMNHHWQVLVAALEYGPIQAAFLLRNALQDTLLEKEYQALHHHLRPIMVSEKLAAAATAPTGKLVAPDLLGLPITAAALPQVMRDRRLDERQQHSWQSLSPLLAMILPEDSSLLERLCLAELTQGDVQELLRLLNSQPRMDAAIKVYALRPETLSALPIAEREALRLALERSRLPDRLGLALRTLAHQQGLNLETFQPYALSEEDRLWMLTHWPELTPFLKGQPETLLLALRQNRYTVEHHAALQGLPSRASRHKLPEADRLQLLENPRWHEGHSSGHIQECLKALRTHKYSVRVWLTLQVAVRTEEEQRLACQRTQQRQRETEGAEMQRRLVAQLRSQYPAEMLALEQLTPDQVLTRLPETFAVFQQEGQHITSALRERAVTEWRNQFSPSGPHTKKRRYRKRRGQAKP
jgi:hypothetical protein